MGKPRPETPTQLLLTNGMWIDVNASNQIAIFGPTGTQFSILADATGSYIATQTTKLTSATFTGKITTYNNIVTAGLGVPAILGAGAQTLYTNVAPTTLSVTPASAVGVYRLHGTLDVLTGATMTFLVIIGYKDPGGNAVTDVPVFIQQNSATLLVGGPGANATGRFTFSYDFATDNSGTAITIGDNSGTYTAGTYYWVPILERLV